MRVVAGVAVVVLACSCTRDAPRQDQPDRREPRERPDEPQQVPRDEPRALPPAPAARQAPCPETVAAEHADAPVVIADGVVVLQRDMPLRWLAADDHVYELASDPRHSKDLGPASRFKGVVWDDRYWYRARCYEDCDDLTSMGFPTAVERIDRVTGERKRLGRGDYGLGSILLFGDRVYWGVFGHQIEGGVSRVPKLGGPQEHVRIPNQGRFDDKVTALRPYRDGILVEGDRTIGWIPANGDRPRTILEVPYRMGSAVRDGDAFYIAERGDPYWQAKDSGYIHRVSAIDGTDTKLAGPLRWPSAIATFGPNVYFALEESGDVRWVPKAGGATRRVPTDGLRIEPCDPSRGLWADERGLFWQRGPTLFGDTARIYFLPWSWIEKATARSKPPRP